MGEVIGREVKPVKVDVRKPTKKTEPGDEQRAMLQKMFDWYDHHPLLGNAVTLRTILQHEPRTLRQYFEELAAT
jgi:hypothetical protein